MHIVLSRYPTDFQLSGSIDPTSTRLNEPDASSQYYKPLLSIDQLPEQFPVAVKPRLQQSYKKGKG